MNYPTRALSHQGDPDTSSDAARSLGRAEIARERILTEFISALPAGLTADEASRLAGYEPQEGSGRRRVSDLFNLGLLEDTGERAVGDKGRRLRILRAVI